MIPYIPTTKPMTGEEQNALIGILSLAAWNTPSDSFGRPIASSTRIC